MNEWNKVEVKVVNYGDGDGLEIRLNSDATNNYSESYLTPEAVDQVIEALQRAKEVYARQVKRPKKEPR